MKIVFFCGSLEPGRDGVGDYCRNIATELHKLGNVVKLIALNDRCIGETIEENEIPKNGEIGILRFSHKDTRENLLKLVNRILDDFRPDYCSLQYVPYAFQIKGIPFKLGGLLSKLKATGKWQVMVHEPFIDTSLKQSLKKKILRRLQVLCLQYLLKKIRPSVVHTSILYYKDRLGEQGIQSTILPLFGNIKVASYSKQVDNTKVDLSNLVGVYFGSAPEEEKHGIFAEKLRDYCKEYNAAIELLLCGKNGLLGSKFIEVIEIVCKDVSCKINLLGEMSDCEISNVFMKSNFGISRNSPEFVEKSGSSISMLEHGLPLWIPIRRAGATASEIKFRPELCFENLSSLPDIKRAPLCSRLSKITHQFLNDLA